jgi:hypothetical protein
MNRTLEAVERVRLAIHYHLKSLIIVIAAGFACWHFASFTPHGVCEFEQPSWLTWYVQLPGGHLKLSPSLPPLRDGEWSFSVPLPDPLVLPPCVSLFTVAHAPFGLLLANASGFVAFLDVLGLSLLLVGVAGFVSPWHHDLFGKIDFLKLLFDARLLAHFVNELGRLRLGEIFPERERLACLFRQGL